MGLAKVSLMTMFIVMATNLRLAQTFRARHEKAARDAAREAAGHVRQRRQPRFHTRLRAEMDARIAVQRELAAVGDARAAGPPARSSAHAAAPHFTAVPTARPHAPACPKTGRRGVRVSGMARLGPPAPPITVTAAHGALSARERAPLSPVSGPGGAFPLAWMTSGRPLAGPTVSTWWCPRQDSNLRHTV